MFFNTLFLSVSTFFLFAIFNPKLFIFELRLSQLFGEEVLKSLIIRGAHSKWQMSDNFKRIDFNNIQVCFTLIFDIKHTREFNFFIIFIQAKLNKVRYHRRKLTEIHANILFLLQVDELTLI